MRLQLGSVIFHPHTEILARLSSGMMHVDVRFWFPAHITKSSSNGIIGHAINNNNDSNVLSHSKFCAESIFEVGGVWFSADKLIMTLTSHTRGKPAHSTGRSQPNIHYTDANMMPSAAKNGAKRPWQNNGMWWRSFYGACPHVSVSALLLLLPNFMGVRWGNI